MPRPDGWHKHGRVWHLYRDGVWVAVAYQVREGWRWHAFADPAPAVDSEAAAKAAAEAVCRTGSRH